MLANALRCSLFVGVTLLLFLGTGASCNPKHRGVHYSDMQVVGTAQITLLVDSLPVDPRTGPNPFYMELMTAQDTFLVRPGAEELSFPRLTDSLTQVTLYYNDWYCPIRGSALRHNYRELYFPDRAATIVIDTYPFENPMAKSSLKQDKERIYCEIRFQKNGLFTYMTQDKRIVNEVV